MKHEFHAEYPLAQQDSITQAVTIDWLVAKLRAVPENWPELAAIQDEYQRLLLLTQAIITDYKDQARVGIRREPGGLKYWIDHYAASFLERRQALISSLSLNPGLPDLAAFPAGSWALHFTFTLHTPYISRDDTDFYIFDNPVKKEWVFKVPYVAPSQWKGALRAAMRRERGYKTWEQESYDEQMLRLFGNPKGAEEEFFAGCLHFYPTYFKRIGLEVINPHDRTMGSGSQPIYFECVPEDSQGTFTLLYLPLDGPDTAGAQNDFGTVASGIHAMLTIYGFGAKTSSGFGVVKDNVSGLVATRYGDKELSKLSDLPRACLPFTPQEERDA